MNDDVRDEIALVKHAIVEAIASITESLWQNLGTYHHYDKNGQQLGVVDGLYAIAASIEKLTKVLKEKKPSGIKHGNKPTR